VHKSIISAVKRVEFVSDRMTYIILRGRWCHITVLKDHAPTEVKTDDVKDSLAVNKQRSQRFDMERFNLKKLKAVEGKEQFRVEVSNKFAALEDLDTEVEINSAWETIRENIKISAKESLGNFQLKKHKLWFNEGCTKLLDQRKQVKLQWL
jgi:hypothetical protein